MNPLTKVILYVDGANMKPSDFPYSHLIGERAVKKFIKKVKFSGPDECWEWFKPRTYGYLAHDGKRDRSHRVAWTLFNGDIPEGMSVLHKCDNPPCCNPAHLFLGTDLDNIKDAVGKGRMKVPRPDNRGERCGTSKLNWNAVREIRKRLLGGEKGNVLAREFGVGGAAISQIKLGRCWRE